MAVESRECCLSKAMGSSCKREDSAGNPRHSKPSRHHVPDTWKAEHSPVVPGTQ